MGKMNSGSFEGVIKLLRKRLWIVIIIPILCVAFSYALSIYIMKPVYEAKATLIINKSSEAGDSSVQYNDVLMLQKLIKTYSEIAKSRTVLDKAAEKLKAYNVNISLKDDISVIPNPDTQILVVKVESRVPENAMNEANVLAETLIEESKRLLPMGSIQILDSAVLPDNPIKPRVKLNIAAGLFLGISIAFGSIFLMYYLDNTIRTSEDVEKYLDIVVIGTIPKHPEE